MKLKVLFGKILAIYGQPAAIAPWLRLRLPTYGPGFES